MFEELLFSLLPESFCNHFRMANVLILEAYIGAAKAKFRVRRVIVLVATGEFLQSYNEL